MLLDAIFNEHKAEVPEAGAGKKAAENVRAIMSNGLCAEHAIWAHCAKDDVASHTPLPPPGYPEHLLAPKLRKMPPKKSKDQIPESTWWVAKQCTGSQKFLKAKDGSEAEKALACFLRVCKNSCRGNCGKWHNRFISMHKLRRIKQMCMHKVNMRVSSDAQPPEKLNFASGG